MRRITVWHGTDQDLHALRNIAVKNCTCVDTKMICPAHQLLTDQATLDHLAFAATMRDQYRHGEFDPAGEWF